MFVNRGAVGQDVEIEVLVPQLHFLNQYTNSVLSCSLENGTTLVFKYIGRESPTVCDGGASRPIPWNNAAPEWSTFCMARVTILIHGAIDESSAWIPWYEIHDPSAGVTEQAFGIDLSPFLADQAMQAFYDHGEEDKANVAGLLKHESPFCVLELEFFMPCPEIQTRVGMAGWNDEVPREYCWVRS